MLHIIQPSHLGNELVRRGKFFVRDPDLRFAITCSQRMRESWGSHHHHLFDNATRCNPCLCVLEVPHEVTNVVGKLPGRINLLPMQDISLNSEDQYEVL